MLQLARLAGRPLSLIAAVRKGLAAVEVELAAGTSLDEKDDKGATALWHAVVLDQADVVRALLDAGADPDAHGKRCRAACWRGLPKGTPPSPSGPGSLLHEAAHAGATSVFAPLLDRGVRVDVRDGFGDTPLHLACFGHNVDAVRALLGLGADADAVDRAGYAPVDHAHLRLDTLRLLLKHGASAEGGPGADLFSDAAGSGRLDVVNALLEHGADVSAHPSALPEACKRGRADVVKKLIDLGADVDSTISWRHREHAALPAAAMYASTRTVGLLLDKCRHQLDDALVSCVALSSDDTGERPNDRKTDRLQTLELLLAEGAAPSAALHVAAMARDPDYLRRLLKGDVGDINAPDERGEPPLYLAARWGHKEGVLLLLAAGADPRVQGADGKTPSEALDDNPFADAGEVRVARRALKDAGGGPAQDDAPQATGPIGKGDRVRHKKFGAGTVASVEGEGDKRKLRVEFDGLDARTLLARFVERI